jgi:hypothetical protein
VKNFLRYSFLGLAFSAMVSCQPSDVSPKSLINVFLVDAPAKWDSVVVEIEGVELEYIRNNREGQVEQIFIPYELADKEINISQLVAGVSLPVGRRELDLGVITAATLRLGQRHTLFQGERGYPLTIQGGETDFPGEISLDLEAGISYDIIVDLDLEKSITQTGSNPLAFDFQPSIRIISSFGNGSVRGIVGPSSSLPVVYAIQGRDSISTHTNTAGQFEFKVIPGAYTIFIEPKDQQYRSDTLLNIQVLEGEITTLDRITLSRQ